MTRIKHNTFSILLPDASSQTLRHLSFFSLIIISNLAMESFWFSLLLNNCATKCSANLWVLPAIQKHQTSTLSLHTQGFLFAALIVTTQGKLLGKLLGGSSGCGSSGLQFPRLNLLSMLCRPTMSSWATPGYGASWGMGSFSQYPGYGKTSLKPW